MTDKPVVLFTNFIPPYRVPLYRALSEMVNDLRIFISTPMEPNRLWQVDWTGLQVTLQKSIMFKRLWQHPHGFSETLYVHFPYDTLLCLFRLTPKVVISGEFGARTAQAVIYRILNPRSRLIVWATLSDHTEQGRGRVRELLRKWILRHSDAVLVNGRAGARYICRFGYPKERLFYVPQTTDVYAFASVPIEEKNESKFYRLLYVGQLVERKGIIPFLDVLICWAMKNPSRTIEIWIVGEGPLSGLISAKPLPDNLKLCLLGHISYSSLPEIYAKVDIFCFPTLADEWGMVVNEAMAAGLPVLGSVYSQAVEELVEDGLTGWTFRPNCKEEVLSAVDRALQTPRSVLIQMGIRARQRVLSLTPSAVAAKIAEAIKFVTKTLEIS